MQNNDFVAIDFETATNNRMICQVGIVVVKDGSITERYSHLIQPPNNKYDFGTIRVHGITPKMTSNSPTFLELWPEIEHYFVGRELYAHNSSFDEDALYKNLSFYGIMPMGILPFNCTCNAFNGVKLEHLCKGFGIEYDSSKHHDALYDAECCAQFALHLLNNEEPDWTKIESTGRKRTRKSGRSSNTLRGEDLVKDLTNANPDNPFYDRTVVITGEFRQNRRELGRILKSMGADLNSTISKNTNFVLIGEAPGPAKMVKLDKLIFDGYQVTKLYQADIDRILSGVNGAYWVDKVNEKDLDFTYEHYAKNKIQFDNMVNVIASKELYCGKGFSGNMVLFDIITGNLGSFGDNELLPETNICVLSDSTLLKLERGEKDETILYIQDFYNNNKAVVFDFKFMSESDILDFCKKRCEQCGDELTMEYYERYMESSIAVLSKSKYEFKEGKNYCKVDGKYVIKMSDDRTWCPSRQMRGDNYKISED